MVITQPDIYHPGLQPRFLSFFPRCSTSFGKWLTKLRAISVHWTSCLASFRWNDQWIYGVVELDRGSTTKKFFPAGNSDLRKRFSPRRSVCDRSGSAHSCNDLDCERWTNHPRLTNNFSASGSVRAGHRVFRMRFQYALQRCTHLSASF